MTRSEYYIALKVLAQEVRRNHGLSTPRVMLSDLRRVYKTYGVKVVLWKGPLKKVRGCYTNDSMGAEVMIASKLPPEQRIFTMAHELKHHLTDCPGTPGYLEPPDAVAVEIGAEIFAAELIYPEADFLRHMADKGISHSNFTEGAIVRLKRESLTTLSFTSLGKRAEFLGFAARGSLAKVRWKLLEERMYGEPDYKRIQRYRAASKP